MSSHQCIVIAEHCESVGAVLLCRCVAALLLIDEISLGLGQAEESADHAQVLPQGPVLRAGILLPAQQLTQPALRGGTHTHELTHYGGLSTGGDMFCPSPRGQDALPVVICIPEESLKKTLTPSSSCGADLTTL